MRGRLLAAASLVALHVSLTACGTSSGHAVAVTGTDRECTPTRREFAAGRRTFAFTNKAGDVSELYVLKTNGDVVGEVEDVTTGSTRNLTVTLRPGRYALNCKPGQKGDGISTPITVSGKTSAAAGPDAFVAFAARDYTYSDVDVSAVKAGDRVRFQMRNEGTVEHEFEVEGPGGDVLGEIGPTGPGRTGGATLALREPGTYRFVCGIADHEARGMKGTFTVDER
ncbi:MAG: cupredoxin domain-containing protein [Acidimicrobiia bacterium]